MHNKSNHARFFGNSVRSIFLVGLLSLCHFTPAASAATNSKKTPPPVVHRTDDGNIPEVR